jgi:hypothetical protein
MAASNLPDCFELNFHQSLSKFRNEIQVTIEPVHLRVVPVRILCVEVQLMSVTHS